MNNYADRTTHDKLPPRGWADLNWLAIGIAGLAILVGLGLIAFVVGFFMGGGAS